MLCLFYTFPSVFSDLNCSCFLSTTRLILVLWWGHVLCLFCSFPFVFSFFRLELYLFPARHETYLISRRDGPPTHRFTFITLKPHRCIRNGNLFCWNSFKEYFILLFFQSCVEIIYYHSLFAKNSLRDSLFSIRWFSQQFLTVFSLLLFSFHTCHTHYFFFLLFFLSIFLACTIKGASPVHGINKQHHKQQSPGKSLVKTSRERQSRDTGYR